MSDTERKCSPGGELRRTFGGSIRGGIRLQHVCWEGFLRGPGSIRIMKDNMGSLPFQKPQASTIMRSLLDWTSCPDQMCTLRKLQNFRKMLLLFYQPTWVTAAAAATSNFLLKGATQALRNRNFRAKAVVLKGPQGLTVLRQKWQQTRAKKPHITGKGPYGGEGVPGGYLAQIHHKLSKVGSAVCYFKTSPESWIPQPPS